MSQIVFGSVSVEFGARRLLDDVTFTVGAGEHWGIVGRNGTGKTTLFRLLTGAMKPTTGTVVVQAGSSVTLLEQHRDFGDAATVWEGAAGAFAELLALERSLAAQTAGLGDDPSEEALSRYGRDLERFEREGGYTVAPRVDAVLQGLGFDPVDARTRALAALSGGERGRLGLARQLVTEADILLLDEPTNHLDLETTRWLEQHLRDTRRTVMLISHDRAFLSAVVDHVLHLEGGSASAYSGGYEAFVRQRAERRLTQKRAVEKQQRVVAKEEDYIRRNIAGQNSRQAKGRRTRLGRLPRLSPPPQDDDTMALLLGVSERGGDQVIVADGASVAIGARVLIHPFDARVMRGDVVGLIGPNGAGKSTLLRAMMGEHPLAAGTLVIGSSIRAAYYRQDLAQVPLDRSLYDIIADLRPAWERRLVQGHLGRFGFSGDEAQRRADTLSGGERARVALAMLMLSRANLVVLDEPTNHLDVESIEALEDALEGYAGTVLLVSHDRALLRALATRVWVLHEHRMTQFDGTFAEWEVVSRERQHAAAVRAAEEEAVRRHRERQRTQRVERTSDAVRAERRRAQRQVETAEARVQVLEARVASLTGALEDPALYTTSDGVARATVMGSELEVVKRELDRAFELWSAATESLERAATAG